MIKMLRRLKIKIQQRFQERKTHDHIKHYIREGRIPWSLGYEEYKIEQIKNELNKETWDDAKVSSGYGIGLDERIVEFPWIISKLNKERTKLLDAGSTLNHDYVLENRTLSNKQITICTYYPESYSFTEKRINYVYDDLRKLPFLSEWFDEVVCISTLEHIDMDNSMYGYDLPNIAQQKTKSYEYLEVVKELCRVLSANGRLLITVPFGKFEPHGFFQQFDIEMIDRIYSFLNSRGSFNTTYFRYTKGGWQLSNLADCASEESYNPHTHVGLKGDGAAHSRALCCMEFIKAS